MRWTELQSTLAWVQTCHCVQQRALLWDWAAYCAASIRAGRHYALNDIIASAIVSTGIFSNGRLSSYSLGMSQSYALQQLTTGAYRHQQVDET